MKKVILSALFLVAGATFSVNAQQKGNFKIGTHIGFPTGDTSDVSNFNLGADVAYMMPVAQGFKVGLTTGYSHYFGKELETTIMGVTTKHDLEDFGVIPVAATAQFTIPNTGLFIGTDLGYGFFTNVEGKTGGFYFQPKLGYSLNKHDLYIGYKGISNETTVGSFNIGYGFNF